MFYDFPVINNISDVLPAIEGSPEFIVADRGDHTVVNYVVMTPDAFPPVHTAGGSAKMREQQTYLKAVRRECRGMIFDKSGAIIRRPFHKFFNLNQVAETQIDKVDLLMDHVILEKLDGSMIVPYRVRGLREHPQTEGRVIWGTKMGDTDVCSGAANFVKKNPNYLTFFNACVDNYNCNPIFEWMSRDNRIVIDHPEDRLVLTAVREIRYGAYMHDNNMRALAADFDIPVVEEFEVTDRSDMNAVMAFIRAQEGSEGVVIRYANGHMLKIKSEWYTAIHGAKEAITEEKNVVQLIIDNNLDDTKALVLQDDRDNLDRYEKQFWNKINDYVNNLTVDIIYNRSRCKDRKQYALERAKQEDDNTRVATFSFFDANAVKLEDVRQFVIDRFIRQNLGTRTKFTAMKQKVFKDLSLYV